ncbi:flippase [Larkinella ripae]
MASLFSIQVSNFLLPLLTVPYVVRIIGPERLGLLNFSLAYIAYFNLIVNYGFDMAAVRSIAANRNDRDLINRVYSEVIAGKFLLWIVSTIAFTLITLGNPEFKAHLWLHVCTYTACLGMVLSPFWLYQAMEDLSRVAVFNLAVKIVFTLSIFLLIQQADDYLYQNLALGVSQLLVNIVALWLAMRRFQVRFTWPNFRQLRNRFRDDSTLFFSSVMITLYAGSNLFFLGLFSSTYYVGIFAAGTRLEGITRSFMVLGLNQAFFPIVVHAFGQSREQGLAMIRKVIFPLTIALSLLSIGLWVIAPYFIPLFYGPQFQDAIPILRIISLLPVIIGISNLLGIHTMLNLRMDKAFFAITALGSVLGLSLNLLMIQRYNHLGAAYSWVITEAVVMLAMGIYLYTKGVTVFRVENIGDAFRFGKGKVLSFLIR